MIRFSSEMNKLINEKAKELSKLNTQDLILKTIGIISGYLTEYEHRKKTGTSNEMLAACKRAIDIKLPG